MDNHAEDQPTPGDMLPNTPQTEASASQNEKTEGKEDKYDPLDGFQAKDRFEPENADLQDLLPSLRPFPRTQAKQEPFYRRNSVTLIFALLLIAFYGLTSFPHKFERPSQLAFTLGAFYGPSIEHGQWWRYTTATLMHLNPGHLFNNVVGILAFGNLLEPVIGHARLVGLYGVSAVCGLTLVYWLQPNIPTLGASTIDYGLIGAYLTLVLLLRYQYNRKAFQKEFRGAVLFVLMFVAWNWMESATVSLWGHVGGLIGGIACGTLIWASRSSSRTSPTN